MKLAAEAQRHLDKEVLRAKGGKLRDLEQQASGEHEVESKELTTKNKTLWSKTVKRLPVGLAQKLLEEKLQQTEECQSRKAREAKKAVSCRLHFRRPPARNLRLPEHDNTQIVYVKGKRNCTPAPRTGEPLPKLRRGMLSAKLRDRFSHLCIED